MIGVWLEDREIRLRDDLPDPAPSDGEAVIRTSLAGVCNTDLELIRGYYPYTGVLGHEFVGVVEEGPDDLTGRRVVGEINAVCHRCSECRAGRESHCLERTVLGIVGRDGVFAERFTLPAENLHPVPDSIPDDWAVFTEPLAAALEVQEQLSITSGVSVLVVGAGKLGQLIARTISLTGANLTVVSRSEGKLGHLTELGIETATNDALPNRAFDVTVECTGNPEGFAIALDHTRPRGTLVMKSTYAGNLEIDAARLVVDEIQMVGSRCGPFRPALELLERKLVDPTPLMTSRFPLTDALTALEHARKQSALKILLDAG